MCMKSIAVVLLVLNLASIYVQIKTDAPPSSSIGLAAVIMASATGLAWRSQSPRWVMGLTVAAGLLTLLHTFEVRREKKEMR